MSINIAKFQVIPSDKRDIWRGSDILSRQAFPATGNFDLAASAFGRLAVHNDDVVSPGEGFDMHQHDNMEIFTWLVDGPIAHRDSTTPGAETILGRGTFSYINAGTGIRHAELNADDFTSRSFLRVVQMWILPDQLGTPPSRQTVDISAELARGGLFLLAGPAGSGAPIATISSRSTLYAGVLRGAPSAPLPAPLSDDPSDLIPLEHHTHVYCVRGRLAAEVVWPGLSGSGSGVGSGAGSGFGVGPADYSAELAEGDQLHITLESDIALDPDVGPGSAPVSGTVSAVNPGPTSGSDTDRTPKLLVRALEPDTEVLIWTMKP